MPPPLPLVALFVPILLGIMPPKAFAESQGVVLYFSAERYTFLKKVLSCHYRDTMCLIKFSHRVAYCNCTSNVYQCVGEEFLLWNLRPTLTSNLYRNFWVKILYESRVITCVPQLGHHVSDNEIFTENLTNMSLYM